MSDDVLVTRVAELDLADVQAEFARPLGSDSPYHHREATGLEYRRFLLLALWRPDLDIRPSGEVERYWRLHAARPRFAADRTALTFGTALAPERLVPPGDPVLHPPGELVHRLYSDAYPSGDTDLWGWPPPPSFPRVSAPRLGTIHVRLDGAIDDHTRAHLRGEALSRRSGALRGGTGTSTIERGCVSGGFGGFCHADAGPALLAWHWTGPLARRIREETGIPVVPTGVFYNYHRDGDASPLHNDPVATELVVLTLLDGPVEPLFLHPELADVSLSDIRVLARTSRGHPDGGVPFEVDQTPFLMSGQSIPHHRRPASRDAEVVVAAQFFGVVAP